MILIYVKNNELADKKEVCGYMKLILYIYTASNKKNTAKNSGVCCFLLLLFCLMIQKIFRGHDGAFFVFRPVNP